MAETISDKDYRTLENFRFELRRFLRFSEDAARAAGLTPQQHQALLAIHVADTDGMLVGELAERLFLRPHSASELADRLAGQGLVDRAHGGTDKRQVRIGLTGKAMKVLAALSETHRQELRRIKPLLSGLLEAL